MRWILLLAACLVAPSLAASVTARIDAQNYVTLYDTPCGETAVTRYIEDQYRNQFKRAHMVFEGKTYRACWAAAGGAVFVVDEGGDVTPIPLSAFQVDRTVEM